MLKKENNELYGHSGGEYGELHVITLTKWRRTYFHRPYIVVEKQRIVAIVTATLSMEFHMR